MIPIETVNKLDFWWSLSSLNACGDYPTENNIWTNSTSLELFGCKVFGSFLDGRSNRTGLISSILDWQSIKKDLNSKLFEEILPWLVSNWFWEKIESFGHSLLRSIC